MREVEDTKQETCRWKAKWFFFYKICVILHSVSSQFKIGCSLGKKVTWVSQGAGDSICFGISFPKKWAWPPIICYNKINMVGGEACLHKKWKFDSSHSLFHLSFIFLFFFLSLSLIPDLPWCKHRCIYSLPQPMSNQNPRATIAEPPGKQCWGPCLQRNLMFRDNSKI